MSTRLHDEVKDTLINALHLTAYGSGKEYRKTGDLNISDIEVDYLISQINRCYAVELKNHTDQLGKLYDQS